MVKNLFCFLLVASLHFIGQTTKAQAPVAQFTANATQGCAPLVVTFQDQSTGDPKFWNWDLGNGQLSNLQNPTAVYTTPGTYTVSLVVRNSNGTNGITKTNYIRVFASPSSDFQADKTIACLPATIQFTDFSSDTAGTIVKWEWDFGDGTTSSLQNPQKTYTSQGFYSVSLNVTSSTGCQTRIGRYRYIRIVSGITADFKATVDSVCRPPFPVTFSNQTSGPGNLTYSWDFGNGNNSGLQNPSTVYSSVGSYNVTLNATSEYGCSGTVTKPVTITGATTNFTVPDSGCQNKSITFTNASTPAPIQSRWNFGDGTTSDQINPAKTYTSPGIYTVTLVNTYSFCSDSITKQIQILGPPAVDFSAGARFACKGPMTTTFTDLSPNAVAWSWDFGDGGTSTQQNPTHTYLADGSYEVKLTITSSFGCNNTISKKDYIRILKPLASLTNVPVGGCAPFTFSPTYTISSVEGIASYFWDFGDGNTSTAQFPTHTYVDSGTYDLRLRVTTTGGCETITVGYAGVRVGRNPNVDFTVDTTTACAFGGVQFTDLSNPADKWLWEFGDGTTSEDRNPIHNFTDTGYFSVTLTAYNNGCPNTVTKAAYVRVLPPISNFEYTVNCSNKFNVTFNNLSVVNAAYGPIKYHWNFGTGNPADTSNVANPVWTYSTLGSYNVSLTVTNGTCTNTITVPIQLVAEVANFAASKTTACKNEIITLSATTSNPLNVALYQWTINGGTPFLKQRSFDTSFAANGTYSVELTITDKNGCQDTRVMNNYITITGPIADFTTLDAGGCKNSTIRFGDLSTPAGSITEWTWEFGDGKTQTFTTAPFTHVYTDTGYFDVRLTVKDNLGCTEGITRVQQVRITSPKADFGAANTLFCSGGILQFKDSSSGYITGYNWSFGDGGTSTLKDPTHTYAGSDSAYTVALIVTDTVGCSDTTTKTGFIQIVNPKPGFEAIDTSAICPPLETKFTLRASDYESFYWDFGDGQTSTLTNPRHFYNTYGTFNAKLYVVGYGGCLDSAVKTITVYNPYATTIRYSPLDACNQLNVNFNVSPPPNTYFTFYFGDGAADSSQQISFSHLYPTPSFYSPYMIIKDSLDCQVTVGGPDVVRVYGAEPFFGVDRKEFCDNGTVYFTNYTIANDAIVSSTWDFGDGNTATSKDAVHTYNAPGTYIASLTATTERGCTKTLYDTIKVSATPTPIITSPDVVCLVTPITFMGSTAIPDTAITWSWTFGNGNTSTLQNPTSGYTTVGTPTITLEAANYLGCKSNTSKQITVVPQPQINIVADPVVISGTGTIIPVTYSSNVVSYAWTPATNLSCTDCPNPFANPKFTTKYQVTVVDSNGCANAKDITVIVICNDKNYFVPNTFSPNGDGINDIFYPRGTGISRIASMRIFNRWGEMVFEKKDFVANDASSGWNGTLKNKPADQDVYVYVIEFICENAAIIPYRGNVALIR